MEMTKDYVVPALEALKPWMHLLPTDVQRKVRLAEAAIATHGSATSEELRAILGPNWVVARRTLRIVQKYGKDVNCVSLRKYHEAERQAIESRVK
jgi:hypothetical protein